MRRLFFFIAFFAIVTSVKAQNPGDTIEVRAFNYTQTYGVNQWSPGIRDSVINFPTDTSISYEKILMLYNMRCKDGNISPPVTGQTDIGCGEWDMSCNSYLYDSTRVDSLYTTTKSHIISNFSGTTFDYVSTQMNDYYKYFQKNVVVTSIVVDSQYTIGAGIVALDAPIVSNANNVKSQYLFTQAELLAAGAVAGNIDGLILDVASGASQARFFRVRMKHLMASELTDSFPEMTGFSEVYFDNNQFVSGSNRIQFYTPFLWDGTSNVMVEYTLSNTTPTTTVQFNGSATASSMHLQSVDDQSFNFDGANYIEANTYSGIPGSKARTIEAWIKTSITNKEIVGYGKDAGGKKFVFRVNGGGQLRVEVNGGYKYGTTLLNDGEWHHVACVLNGTTVNDITLYIDGVAETSYTTSSRTVITDTTGAMGLRVSRGVNNRYFNGFIDEVRVWDTVLTESTIRKWMYANISNSHPNRSALKLYYQFDENTGTNIIDQSGNGNDGHVIGSSAYKTISGIDLFKSFEEGMERPNTTFLQGTYNLTITTDTVLDTVARAGYAVSERQILSKTGTIYSDQIVSVMDTVFWKAGYEYIYDPSTNSKLDSIAFTQDGTITIVDLPLFVRSPMKFEIMSFVTPYGINLDLGINGKTWTFDMTDYAPMLNGSKRMTIERGGQWMEDMDIRFLFIVGTPPRDVLDINQIWRVDYPSYTDINSDKYFEPRDVLMNADAKAFKVRTVISGHGQEGEFIPRYHYINIDGGSNEFLWKVATGCGDNPIFPQGGTWIYDRAGWCPGAPTDLTEMDITSYVTPGQIHSIDYGVQSASGTSKYIVNHQLVSYGDPNFSLDAAVTDITGPTDKVEYSRENYICSSPGVIIKNTGSTTLTSLTIKYWVNNNPNPNTYNWTGSLDFLESVEVILPSDSMLWSGILPGVSKFNVRIENPNGGSDEYIHNNTFSSNFEIPDVVPANFMIYLYTNASAHETSYKIYNSAGQVVFHKQSSSLSPNTLYRDTLELGVGCYKLKVFDTGGNGLSFFGNSDGNGYINVRTSSGAAIKYLQANFGNSLVYNFTIDFPLTYEDIHMNDESHVYPNPSNGIFNIDFEGQQAHELRVTDVTGRLIKSERIEIANGSSYSLNLGDQAPGVYVLTLEYGNRTEQHKIIVQ